MLYVAEFAGYETRSGEDWGPTSVPATLYELVKAETDDEAVTAAQKKIGSRCERLIRLLAVSREVPLAEVPNKYECSIYYLRPVGGRLPPYEEVWDEPNGNKVPAGPYLEFVGVVQGPSRSETEALIDELRWKHISAIEGCIAK